MGISTTPDRLPASAPPGTASAVKPPHVSWKALAPIAAAIIVALIPPPAGLPVYAWQYFALFAAVIVGLILEPVPAAAVGLIGVTVAAVLGLVFSPEQLADPEFKSSEAAKWALSGFSNTTVWLIFGAFMFALGYEKTGLGKRIALSW